VPLVALGQSVNNPILKRYLNHINEIKEKLPIEKLYLQLDKPSYVVADTLHFKCYLLNADYLTPSTKSGLLYVELANTNNKVVKRIVVPVASGISWGDIALDEKDIPDGSYTLRAYTNWMKNFGEDFAYKRNIYVSAVKGTVLVTTNFKLDTLSETNKIQATLQFSNLNKSPLILKNMLLKVRNGYNSLGRYNVLTGMDGSAKFDFSLADKAQLKNLNILVEQRDKGADTAVIGVPVIINRPEKMDLQFMPEGGNLVAGIPIKVGFKALNEDGKGATVNGEVFNSKQQQVAVFKSVHNGMGAFEFTPKPGEKYYSKVILTDGDTKNYPLPAVKSSGTVLKIDPVGNDSLQLKINATANTPVASYYLIARSRGVVCYAEVLHINSEGIKKTLPKSLFPTGIVHFALLDVINRPINERLVYIHREDNLKISIAPNRVNYGIRDSIALALQVNDKDGKPVQGTFSLAVTDDSQVKKTAMTSNLINHLLFTSDLKGDVEEPGYYFENDSKERAAALDNLLLTQGWVGYSWDDIFNSENITPKYPAEKEFTIEGKVVNAFKKPVKKSVVSLLRKHPTMAADTVTDNDGRFAFRGDHYLPADSAFFFIDVKNRRGNHNNLNVEINEFTPFAFSTQQRQVPWYVNSDSILLNNSSIKLRQLQTEANIKGEGLALKGSQNPRPESTDEILDEKDMNEAKTMTLWDLLDKKFHLDIRMKRTNRYYVLNHSFVVLLYIDGMPARPEIYLNYLTAKDVRGIEIDYVYTVAGLNKANVHVTTFSGHGINYTYIPGTYVYKPIPFNKPTEFYRPRYTIKNSGVALGTDMRSVIHWEPNVVTDKDGKAVVSFFSADKLTDYTVVTEGTDLQGNIGSQQSKIKVDLKPNP
jgi:hypothetical protein